MPTPQGSIGEVKVGPQPDAPTVARATDTWQSATTDFSLLAVFDVSGSMKEKVGGTTRVAITQEAAGIALSALPKTTKLGLWFFSIGIGAGGADHKEVAPIGRLDDEGHRARVAAGAASLSKSVGGGTGLYDTIWAAYQTAKQNYDPDRVNAVVVLTDGRNEDPGGLSLDAAQGQAAGRERPDEADRHHDHRHRARRRPEGAHGDLDDDLLRLLLRAEPGRHDDRAGAGALRPRVQGRSLRLSTSARSLRRSGPRAGGPSHRAACRWPAPRPHRARMRPNLPEGHVVVTVACPSLDRPSATR